MTLDELTERIRQRAATAPPLGYKVKFDLGEDGAILWDGTTTPAQIAAEDGDADTTIGVSAEDLTKLIDGSLNPTLAYMTGRLKISGSMGVALKVSQLLED